MGSARPPLAWVSPLQCLLLFVSPVATSSCGLAAPPAVHLARSACSAPILVSIVPAKSSGSPSARTGPSLPDRSQFVLSFTDPAHSKPAHSLHLVRRSLRPAPLLTLSGAMAYEQDHEKVGRDDSSSEDQATKPVTKAFTSVDENRSVAASS